MTSPSRVRIHIACAVAGCLALGAGPSPVARAQSRPRPRPPTAQPRPRPPVAHAPTAHAPTPPPRAARAGVTVALGGDVLLGRGVARAARLRGWPAQLAGLAPLLGRADLAIVNLESPLAPCLAGGTRRQPRLCGAPAAVAALVAAGVDAVTLANNHALDAGPAGLRATAARLARHGIRALGLTAALTGRLVAEPLGPLQVIAANLTPPAHPPGARVPRPRPVDLARAVAAARRRWPARPVLVLLHLGREGDPYPGPRERAYGRAAVTAGAAAVVLHGAHRRRALVRDRGVPVHLGLGNLRFDQRDPRARLGAVVTLRLAPGCRRRPAPPAAVVGEACVDSRRGAPVPCPVVSPQAP